MAQVTHDPDLQLGIQGGVALHQRKVGVGGGAGDDLDPPLVLKKTEGADQVPLETLAEGTQDAGVPVLVETGQVEEMGGLFPGFGGKARDILSGPFQFLEKKGLHMIQDLGVGQLLGQDGGDADGQMERNAPGAEVVKDVQEGKVGLGHGLVEHLLAVGPAAGLSDVGQVGVQNKNQVSRGHRVLLSNSQNLPARWRSDYSIAPEGRQKMMTCHQRAPHGRVPKSVLAVHNRIPDRQLCQKVNGT